MAHVTFCQKCYIYSCLGCGLLGDSSRRDRVTCSTRCRVRAHRNGKIRRLRDAGAKFGFPYWLGPQIEAAQTLVPDLYAIELAGSGDVSNIRAEVWSAYWALVNAEIEARRAKAEGAE